MVFQQLRTQLPVWQVFEIQRLVPFVAVCWSHLSITMEINMAWAIFELVPRDFSAPYKADALPPSLEGVLR